MLNKSRIILTLVLTFIFIMLSIILPVNNVYAYTVDDVRDIVGKVRVDEIFTENEIAEIVEKYNNIERANLIAKMFEMGKIIDVDSKTEEEYLALDKEINSLKDKLTTDFKGGKVVTEVLKTSTELGSALYKADSLKEKGVVLQIEYIENKWADDYIKVQDTVEKMSKDFEIGRVGEGLRSPVYSGFVISSPFGFRLDPITRSEVTFHNGLDLSADLDDPIMAVWNGVVTRVYVSETGGNTIEITHGEGLVTKYLHLNTIGVKIGQEVRQYQVIAGAGSTGTRSTGPHLHLIVELDGEKINPIYLFGSLGLNAFKTYLSYNPERNRELLEVESNIKPKPTKNEEVVEVNTPKYERVNTDKPEGTISTIVDGAVEVNPYNPSESVYKNEHKEEKETEAKAEASKGKE